jgi:hypothetical protein
MAIIGPLPNNILAGQLVSAAPVMANYNWILSQVNANAMAFVAPGTAGNVLTSNGAVFVSAPVGSIGGFADQETPGGVINGVNTAFTLAHTPSVIASCIGYVREGGIGAFLPLMVGIDFTVVGTSLTMTQAPHLSSNFFVYYRF